MKDDEDIPVIALDANALISLPRRGGPLSRLLSASKLGQVKLFVPYVAFWEFYERCAWQSFERRRRDRTVAPESWPHWSSLVDSERDKWQQIFESCHVEILGIEDAHINEAERRKRENLAPFTPRTGRQRDNDFRDALILCAIRPVSLTHEGLIFVSNDGELRKTIITELGIEVRKNCQEFLTERFANDETSAACPIEAYQPGDPRDPELIKQKYSHPDFETFKPNRSHNRLNLERKLSELAKAHQDQVCSFLAVAKLFQPATVSNTKAVLRASPFEFEDHASQTALDVLKDDGSVKVVGDVIIVQDEDFAEQAIGKLGNQVVSLMRTFDE